MPGLSKSARVSLTSAASVIGVLLLVAGGLLALFTGEISAVVFACVAAGIAALAVWMIGAPGEFQAWIAGRQTRFGTTSLLITILFTGFVVAGYVLVARSQITVDLTSVQRYSLNKPTLDAIERLRSQGYHVRIAGFFSRYKLREAESADLLLRQYVAQGRGAIDVQMIDPDERPDTAQRYGYQPGYDGGLFLAVLGPDGEPDFSTTPLYLGGANERDITTGLLTIASAGSIKVYFTTGHGELKLDQVDETGISRLAASLVDVGIAVEPLTLLNVVNSGIPADASAVLIVGPRGDFSAEEITLLDDYLNGGGRLAIFADPPLVEALAGPGNTFLQQGTLFNDYLWDKFGVRVRDALVIETQSFDNSEFNPVVNATTPNPLLSLAQDAPIEMNFVRPLELVTTPQGDQSAYERTPLFYSTDASYGETNLEGFVENSSVPYDPGVDLPGPLLLGVTIRHTLEFQEQIQPRVVIIGDSDVVKNEFVRRFPGNVWLWTDIINWLTGFEQQVSFTPVSDPTLLNLVATRSERNTIATITMVVLPGLVLLAGAAVWWVRQR